MKKKLVILGLTAAALTATSQAALVAHWNFEENTGNTTNEQVKNITSSTFTSTWHTDASAPDNNYSVGLNGSSITTNVTAADIGITGNGAKTFVMWFKTGATSQQTILGYSPTKGGGPGQDLRFFTNADGGLRMEVSSGGFDFGSGYNDNEWHMAAFILNSGDGINDVDVYVDGTYTTRSGGGQIIDTTDEISNAGTDIFLIGQDGNTDNGRFFTGQIDQIMIFDEALTEAALNNLAIIPEPTTALLGALGSLLLLRRRRA